MIDLFHLNIKKMWLSVWCLLFLSFYYKVNYTPRYICASVFVHRELSWWERAWIACPTPPIHFYLADSFGAFWTGGKAGFGVQGTTRTEKKSKWFLMLFQGLRVIGHCVRIDYQCYWKRGRWVSIPFLMMLPFEESCFCPIACGLVYGMVYMDFMEGLVSLAWGRYLKRFFRGANRVWRLRAIHGKPVWFLKSEEAFAVCF